MHAAGGYRGGEQAAGSRIRAAHPHRPHRAAAASADRGLLASELLRARELPAAWIEQLRLLRGLQRRALRRGGSTRCWDEWG